MPHIKNIITQTLRLTQAVIIRTIIAHLLIKTRACFTMLPSVSIVIPIYRDKEKIGSTIDLLADFMAKQGWNAELIIVNDGGTDGGVRIVEEKKNLHPFIKLINRTINKGKGYTVREGLATAKGDFLFFTDADLPYLTKPIATMFKLLNTGKTDLVLASRDQSDEQVTKPNWPRQITHVFYSHFVRFFIPIPFSDTLAGLKGMRQEVARVILPELTVDRFSFDVELILATQIAGFKITELPVSLKNVGKSNLNIRRDAPKMIEEIWHIWRNYKKGHYR